MKLPLIIFVLVLATGCKKQPPIAVTHGPVTKTPRKLAAAVQTGQSDNRYCSADNKWLGTGELNPVMRDGPASLPRECFNTDPANTPSPGPVIHVAAGESFESAYNNAECGSTILLAHGASWDDPFTFAAKNCDDGHWITIKSDGEITPPGVRITPAYKAQMANLNMRTPSGGLRVVGDHMRFIGIYFTKALPKTYSYLPAMLANSNKVIFDRVYVHCNPGEECQHGVTMTTGKYVAVIDSWFDEFHCIAAGSCVDSQAVAGGWKGSATVVGIGESGPMKIVNNFLEASTENIMFGGAAADGAGPNDVEIRRNYLYKDPRWNPSSPDYGGIKYVVKNCFELKNGTHILFEGNVCENIWGGFTQGGYAILLTPKSSSGTCPRCAVDDVTLRYNRIEHSGAAMIIASVRSGNTWSDGIHRVSVHDNIFDDLEQANCFGCDNFLIQIASGYDAASPPDDGDVLSDVSIRSNDFVAAPNPVIPNRSSGLLMLSGIPPEVSTVQVYNIAFVDNLASTLLNGAYSTGGGTNNCASIAKPPTSKTMWTACYIGDSPLTGNVLVNYPKSTTDWPEGNLFAPNWAAVGFDSYADGVLSLQQDNAYFGKGANVDAVKLATFGVAQH